MANVTLPVGARYADDPAVKSNPYTPPRLPVIGEVERSGDGHTIIRAGLTLSQTDRSWEQTLHLVLTPDEREALIAELIAQR